MEELDLLEGDLIMSFHMALLPCVPTDAFLLWILHPTNSKHPTHRTDVNVCSPDSTHVAQGHMFWTRPVT